MPDSPESLINKSPNLTSESFLSSDHVKFKFDENTFNIFEKELDSARYIPKQNVENGKVFGFLLSEFGIYMFSYNQDLDIEERVYFLSNRNLEEEISNG